MLTPKLSSIWIGLPGPLAGLMGRVSSPACVPQVKCFFIIDATGGHIHGDVGLYLGDLEVYRRDPGARPLPSLPHPTFPTDALQRSLAPAMDESQSAPRGDGGGEELRAVVFREAESKFPAHAWAKYSVNITYNRAAQVAQTRHPTPDPRP